MENRWHWIVLSSIIIIVVFPILLNSLPLYYFHPDVQYVKAKVLRVMEGDLFEDPVTGYPSFHPPYYHLFLSLWVRIGINLDILLLTISCFNVILVIMISYLILRELTNPVAALLATSIIPFIYNYMGPGHLLLATSYYFSIPFFLIGLLLYLQSKNSSYKYSSVGFLWGLSFLFSSIYIFVIIFTFLYELFWKRNYRSLFLMYLIFGLTVSPFYWQTWKIVSAGMSDTSAFAIWRGIPGWDYLIDFFKMLAAPASGYVIDWRFGISIFLFLSGLAGIIKRKGAHPILLIVSIALIITAYHFDPKYAGRIFLIAVLFLTAYAAEFWLKLPYLRTAGLAILISIAAYGLIDNHVRNDEIIKANVKVYDYHRTVGKGLWENLTRYMDSDSFLLASEATYRHYIMAYIPVHALMAYKTGEYFQLNTEIADRLQLDYERLMSARDLGLIEQTCQIYKIKTAVVGNRDKAIPAFQLIEKVWTPVYQDSYFSIYLKP